MPSTRPSRVRAQSWIAGWWAAGRALVLGAAAMVHFFGPRGWTRPEADPHLLGVLGAWDGRWFPTPALLTAGTLARPETLFVALRLLPLAVRERRSCERGLAVGAVLAPAAALGSFALYLGLTLHDPLAWTHAERAWGRHF